MSERTALITGVTGQDGSYLAEYLLGQGYRVCAVVRHSATENFWRIEHIRNEIELLHADLLDQTSLDQAVLTTQPDEVYNLAAQSFVPMSFQQPLLTGEFTGLGVTRVLEAVRKLDNDVRFYQASSSEMFGKVREVPQNELTAFHPRSPYGCAKAYGHFIAVNYRESYDIKVSCGILFNHESPRRGLEFVTRKITNAAARIKLGLQSELRLGNLEAKRDWGYAGDYVRAIHLMLQHPEAEDWVIASGETHSIEEFVELAFDEVGLDWHDYVVQDERFMRPAEVDCLVGDATKARNNLGWQAEIDFPQLVSLMVQADLEWVEGMRYRAEKRPAQGAASPALPRG